MFHLILNSFSYYILLLVILSFYGGVLRPAVLEQLSSLYSIILPGSYDIQEPGKQPTFALLEEGRVF